MGARHPAYREVVVHKQGYGRHRPARLHRPHPHVAHGQNLDVCIFPEQTLSAQSIRVVTSYLIVHTLKNAAIRQLQRLRKKSQLISADRQPGPVVNCTYHADSRQRRTFKRTSGCR